MPEPDPHLPSDPVDLLLGRCAPPPWTAPAPQGLAARITAQSLPRRTMPRIAGSRPGLVAAVVALLAVSAAAAASSSIWPARPQVDPRVPAAPEWQFYPHDPYRGPRSGPVLLRIHPAWLADANRRSAERLRAGGIAGARCGVDGRHPLACYRPDGRLIAEVDSTADPGPGDVDLRPLSGAQARAWLCAHPDADPATDYGERRAPSVASARDRCAASEGGPPR